MKEYLDAQEASRKRWEANGGNAAVHETWARLRALEPTYKESYISLVPNDFVGTAWYYTKWALKALFMNAPSREPVTQDEAFKLRPELLEAVNELHEAASFADEDAMYLLGEMGMHGNFSHPHDPQSAFNWFSQLAELTGNDTAQYMIGLLHATGIGGVERNQAKALLYHDFAAEQGNVRSEMTLAFRYHMGIGTSRDCDKAVNYYKRVADKAMEYWHSGPPGGLLLSRNSYRWVEATGGAYGEGASASSSGPNAPSSGGFAGNIEDVLEYLSLRESSGDLGATYQLGKHYYDPPRGYRRNLRAAQRQFNKIARLYWGKDGKVNPRAPEGIDKVAGKAAAYLGRMFLRGEGMEQNFEKAINFFKLGIKNGDAFAQYHLGLMYRDGLGVPQDGVRAGTLLKSAAEQGSAVAQSALGVMFLDQGDIDTAGRYFELAASAGVMEAFYYLAELTNLGVGRERNCGLAAVYYKVVAERTEGLHSSFLEANNAFERGDYERAFIPMLMAAEQGYEHAQANVAHLLDRHTSYLSIGNIPFLSHKAPSSGSKLLDNFELALVYFTRSARQANVDSMVKMGDYYLAGLGHSTPTEGAGSKPVQSLPVTAEPDVEKATTCYTQAAENHHSAQALWNLGWLHENGIGAVKQDFHMAKRYYDLAYEMNKDAAYLPVKLALIKLRLRSWWNGVSGGKVNPIRDDDEDGPNKKPKTFWEWLNRFLDNFEEMDAQEAARQTAQQGQEGDLDWLAAEPGMPGGDADYAAGGRADRGNAAGYDGAGDDWEDFDDGLVESLIIIALAGALALLVYARQQQQQGRNNNGNAAAGGQQQNGGAGGFQPMGLPGGQQAAPQQQQQPPPQPDQQQRADRGMFPQPGDPDFNNWVAGGIGH